ncbi:MAG: hypothetical protein HKO66_05710 [Saprospiraceae bacterium]|nr:hypothetical protein [Bacteroidia bacterium]NNE13868.1 hypothetical protein [Saprospiraceae bacterium]NNL91706.1 hypothetical protein [Saprospiraceae bacterium]
MKKLKPLLLLVLLFALPAASWYFLKGGLDWRKGKVLELSEKGRFIHAFDFENKDKDILFEKMTHKTCVVKFKDDITELDQSMIDQFKNAHTFKYISLSKTEVQPAGWNSKSAVEYYKPSNIETNNKKFKNIDYMIVDTSGFIRQYYEGSGKKVLTQIIEDLAVILPRKKPKDIKMKADEND